MTHLTRKEPSLEQTELLARGTSFIALGGMVVSVLASVAVMLGVSDRLDWMVIVVRGMLFMFLLLSSLLLIASRLAVKAVFNTRSILSADTLDERELTADRARSLGYKSVTAGFLLGTAKVLAVCCRAVVPLARDGVSELFVVTTRGGNRSDSRVA
jgi:hypothetical protein